MSSPAFSADPRYAFKCTWLDTSAGFERPYLLTYYVRDGTVEIFDVKNHRMFLKRCKAADIPPEELYIGSSVVIYARQFKLTDFADEYTRKALSAKKERCCVIIKPDVYDHTGELLDIIYKNNLYIAQLKTFRLTKSECTHFFSSYSSHPQFAQLISFMANDLFVGMDIVGEDAVARLWELAGPENPAEAKRKAPSSIRAKFGSDWVHNAMYVSESVEAAQEDLVNLFATPHETTAILTDCTLCVILPHIIEEGKAGEVMAAIQNEGFDVSCMELFRLDHGSAFDFLEVYQQVLPEFTAKVDQLSSGPCIAMEIRGENVHKEFREFCGPYDPTIAKHLAPKSLRAIFGKSKVMDAVHCTDLEDDCSLECEHFFQILQ